MAAVNKVIIRNNGLEYIPVDLTGDNVEDSDVRQGKIFHKADGTPSVGTSTAIDPTGTLNINFNGIYDVSTYENAEVLVDLNLENKQITVTTNTTTVIEPSQGYSGLGRVEVITEIPPSPSILSSRIRVAELPSVSFTLSKNGEILETKETPALTGGIVDFTVLETGTYTITATGTGITTWTNTIEVKELGTIEICKGAVLNNYTPAQIHTICQGGYFSKMFNIKDELTIIAPNSVLNNEKVFVEDIIEENGQEFIDWRANRIVSAGSYMMNNRISFLSDVSSSTSWTNTSYGYGGYKYSTLRQTMMKQGDEIYSQATGILPNNYTGSLTGIKFNNLKYTNGESCPVYSYNCITDEMTILSDAINGPSQSATMFIKGYFKSVGEITQSTFNNGVYYIYSNYIYSKANSYSSGTTYYGLYETLQEDGFFTEEIFKTEFANYLTRRTMKASAGGNQTTTVNEFSDYCTLPAVEEITGLHRGMILPSGLGSGNTNFLSCVNLDGEDVYKPAYDFMHIQGGLIAYFTRSIYDYNSLKIDEKNNILITRVSNPYYVRPGFRTC